MKARDIFSSGIPVGVVYRSNTPNGLQFVRSLGEAGVPVLAMSDGSRFARMYSKYAYCMQCPDGLREESSFVQCLIETGKKLQRKATLYIMNDPHLIVVAAHRDNLDRYFQIPLPRWEVMQKCLHKAQMVQAASEADIPVPVTFAPTSNEELEHVAQHIPYPCILKPISRYEYRNGALRQRAFQHTYDAKALRAHNATDLRLMFRRVLADDFQVIVQEEIPGSEDVLYTVGLYADTQSNLRGVFVGRKLHQFPPDFGLCTYGESVIEPKLASLGEQLVHALGFHGIAQIEFKLDARDGLFKLMEINPRGWQWSYLSTACGVNLPYLAYCDLNGLPLSGQKQSTERQTWTHMADEFQRFWQFGRIGKLCERTSGRDWLAWAWKTLLSKDNHDAVLCRRDPVPGLMMIMRGLLLRLRRGVGHLSLPRRRRLQRSIAS